MDRSSSSHKPNQTNWRHVTLVNLATCDLATNHEIVGSKKKATFCFVSNLVYWFDCHPCHCLHQCHDYHRAITLHQRQKFLSGSKVFCTASHGVKKSTFFAINIIPAGRHLLSATGPNAHGTDSSNRTVNQKHIVTITQIQIHKCTHSPDM